jgi:hypothetical protein
VQGESFRCGGWTVTAGSAGGDGGAWLTARGSGNWLDGLRALCAAAWTAGLPPGGPADRRQAADAAIAATMRV